MKFPRVVATETLDGLAWNDPAAMHSRRDLQRVHRAMGTRATVLKALRGMQIARRRQTALRVLELGAGDGSLMLGVARTLAPVWPKVELTLLDRQPLIGQSVIASFAGVGWAAVARVADALDWATEASHPPDASGRPACWDLIVVNLFLHHFEGAQLSALLTGIAGRSDRLVACEPHRGWLALGGSHLVGALGANAVTREDAVLSVRAGFRGRELTALWPQQTQPWTLHEARAGLFSHCFCASRDGAC